MKAKSYPVRDSVYIDSRNIDNRNIDNRNIDNRNLSSRVHSASKSPLPRPVRVGERAGLSVVRGDSGRRSGTEQEDPIRLVRMVNQTVRACAEITYRKYRLMPSHEDAQVHRASS